MNCPKCGSPLNVRRGAHGPWLGCSRFPKCRGRLGWTTMDAKIKEKWERALEEHEKANPQKIITKLGGEPVGDSYKPNVKNVEENGGEVIDDMEQA